MDPIGILTCQSLAAEISRVAEDLEIPAVVRVLPSSLDLYPSRLYRLVDVMLGRMTSELPQVVLGYGHCCFLIEDLAQRHRAAKIKGNNCYEILAGQRAVKDLEASGQAYYLTPFHCRNFDQVVSDGFGDIERMKDQLAGTTQLVYLDTGLDEALIVNARDIALKLGMPLTVHFVGLGQLRAKLMDAIKKGSIDDHTVP
jgi:hypothetical protein